MQNFDSDPLENEGRDEPPPLPPQGGLPSVPSRELDHSVASGRPSNLLPWIVIVLAIVSAGCVIIATYSPPGTKLPGVAWAVILSFVAMGLGRFVKRMSSSPLARLACQFGVGFFVIAVLGTIAVLIQDAVFFAHTIVVGGRVVHGIWGFLHSAGQVVSGFFHHTSSAPPGSTPVPSPTP